MSLTLIVLVFEKCLKFLISLDDDGPAGSNFPKRRELSLWRDSSPPKFSEGSETKQATMLSRGGNTVGRQKHPHEITLLSCFLGKYSKILFIGKPCYYIVVPFHLPFIGVKWYRFTKDFKVQWEGVD